MQPARIVENEDEAILPPGPVDVRAARLGPLRVDFERRAVHTPQRERRDLTETEAAILGFLVANKWRAVSREELLACLWGIRDGVETRTIDMHVARLRTKLRGPWGRHLPEAIITVRSQGYRAGPGWELLATELC